MSSPNIATTLAVLATLTACATRAPLAIVAMDTSAAPGDGPGQGTLVVYSTTFTPTLEEGEYPAHTDYTIATTSDQPVEQVKNQTGSFDKRPAAISLVSGQYHVRAQYARGGFVIVPVVIWPGKTTTVDLDGGARPQSVSAGVGPIHLPNGDVIGWEAVAD